LEYKADPGKAAHRKRGDCIEKNSRDERGEGKLVDKIAEAQSQTRTEKKKKKKPSSTCTKITDPKGERDLLSIFPIMKVGLKKRGGKK